jgi:hypothetical protein
MADPSYVYRCTSRQVNVYVTSSTIPMNLTDKPRVTKSVLPSGVFNVQDTLRDFGGILIVTRDTGSSSQASMDSMTLECTSYQ